ncbi:hypothetical protein V1264_010222 [Littorina saxatilis]|uniref:Calponin-homology (CH) domain-containing protein n=2 Tax=Littorina saxatilis TaxID=31220 RepID=A0AAN9G0F2_9CAEN
MSLIRNADDLEQMGEQELEELYTWIDGIPLTRPKRNIARDFSDGVLVAEVVKHFHPKLVDVHNYSPANATPQKMQNWMLLNRKVFKNYRFELSEDIVRNISNAKPGVIERVLFMLRSRIDRSLWEQQHMDASKGYENERPEADQRHSPRKDAKAVVTRNNMGVGGGQKFNPSKAVMDDTVPLILLEEKEQEILAKNETIQILQAKIKRLEHLLHLKDIRIEDMQQRLESTRATGKR